MAFLEIQISNSLSDAAIQAEIFKKFAPPTPPAGAAPQPGQGVPNVTDPTGAGNGNIGVGQAPQPGEPGFSGNTGGGCRNE